MRASEGSFLNSSQWGLGTFFLKSDESLLSKKYVMENTKTRVLPQINFLNGRKGNRRILARNPRSRGTNPRAKGTNPRAIRSKLNSA